MTQETPPSPYDDREYCIIPYDKLVVAELMLFNDIVCDADLQAVVIPAASNVMQISMLMAKR